MYCLSNFCCVCFTHSKEMQNLQNLDADGISLLEKIKFCTFENEWIENVALYICAVCHTNLKVSYEFKKKCSETNKLLRGYIFQLQQSSVSMQKQNADLNVSLIDVQPSTPIFELIKNDDSENELDYSLSTLDFEKYEEVIIKEEPKENCSNEEISTDCKEIIDYSEQYSGFPRQSISNSIKYLSKVVISLNAEIVRFVKFSEYVREKRRVNSCPICLRKFSRPNGVYAHMLIHKNKKPFSCTVCNRSFRQKQNMVTHMSIHSGVTYYKCTLCEKSFYHYSHLTAHMSVHTGEKPHECTVCQKRFGTKSHLTSHMTSHNKYKYRCTVCKKEFKQKFSLIRHKRVHTGERPYKCSVCDKRFTQRPVMLTHQLLHSGEKPYACPQCPKKYSVKSYLKMHQLVHSDEKTFKCKYCSKLYKHRPNLYKHVRNCHEK